MQINFYKNTKLGFLIMFCITQLHLKFVSFFYFVIDIEFRITYFPEYLTQNIKFMLLHLNSLYALMDRPVKGLILTGL